MKKKISDKDLKSWNTFINSKERLKDKEEYNSQEKNFDYRTLDLHGFNIRDANEEVDKLIINAYNKGIYRLIIITGKGLRSKNMEDPYASKDLGILKYAVPDYIKNSKHLMDKIKHIDLDQVNDLNKGSFSLILKKK